MNLDFDLDRVVLTEFGVGREEAGGEIFTLVPVDAEVQAALLEMVIETRRAIDSLGEVPEEYEPSEKFAAKQYVSLPVNSVLAEQIHHIHTAENLHLSANALLEPANIFCYFARLTDKKGQRLTAVRRSVQFKGVLKSRLIRMVSDSMKLVTETVFKLDRDFDLLVDQAAIHVLRPSALESIGKLQAAILAAVPANISAIEIDLPFVNFESISEYASHHSRAARSLAALRSRDKSKGINRKNLCEICAKTGVTITEVDGKINVGTDHVVAFLEVLDRRRYEVVLVADSPEPYRASSRQRI